MTVIAKLLDPLGNQIVELPDFITVSPQEVLNDVGGWSMDYPISGLYADQLIQDRDLEVAVLFDEIEVYRGLIEDDTWDQIEEDTKEAIVTVSGRDISALLSFAVMYPAGGIGANTSTRKFTSKTIGYILKTCFDEAYNRGGLNYITYNFDAVNDSSGNPWSSTITMTFQVGVNLLDMLIGFAQAGYIDWNMDQHTLKVYNPGTTLAAQKNVTFYRGTQIQNAPRSRSRRNLATAFLVYGDNNVNIERTNAAAITARGRKEAFLSQGGTEDTAVLQYFADLQLSIRKLPRLAKTHSLLYPPGSPQPWIDFTAGNYVNTDLTGTVENYRVVQFSCVLTSQGVKSGDLSLNDRFAEREVRVSQVLQGLQSGGKVVTGGSTPASPPPPAVVVDTLAPAAPTNVLIAPSTETDAAGYPHGAMTVSWTAVTTNNDGPPATAMIDFDHYEISWVYPSAGTIIIPWYSTTNTSISFSNLPMNVTVQAQVRAVDIWGNRGPTTTSAVYTIPIDTAGPTKAPSNPTLDATTYLSIIRATWNGNYADGTAAKSIADFDHIEVHASSTGGSGFVPDATTLIATMKVAGSVPIPADAGVTYNVKFIAVDTLGNKGPASGATAGTGSGIAFTDLDGTTQATLNSSGSKNHNFYQGSAPTGSSLVVNDLWFDTAHENKLAKWDGANWIPFGLGNAAFSNIDAGKITSGQVDAAYINVTGVAAIMQLNVANITAGRINAPYIELGGRLTTAVGGVQTGPRVELDGAGFRAYNSSSNTVPVVNIDSSGNASFTGNVTGSSITGSSLSTDSTQPNYVAINATGLQITHQGTTNYVRNPSTKTTLSNTNSTFSLYGGAYISNKTSTGVNYPGGIQGGSLSADPYIVLHPTTTNLDTVLVGGLLGMHGLISSKTCVYGWWNPPAEAGITNGAGIGFALDTIPGGSTVSYSVYILTYVAGRYYNPSKFGLAERAGSNRFVTSGANTNILMPVGQYIRVTGTVTLPSDWNASAVLVSDYFRTSGGAYVTGASGTLNVMYATAAQVEIKSYVTDVISGDMPGGSWVGTQWGSKSIRAATVATAASTGSGSGSWPTWYGEVASPGRSGWPSVRVAPQFPAGLPPQPIVAFDPNIAGQYLAALQGYIDNNNNAGVQLAAKISTDLGWGFSLGAPTTLGAYVQVDSTGLQIQNATTDTLASQIQFVKSGDQLWFNFSPPNLALGTNTLPLIIGLTSATNLAFDNNSLAARNNGASASIYINPLGPLVDNPVNFGDTGNMSFNFTGNLSSSNRAAIRTRNSAMDTTIRFGSVGPLIRTFDDSAYQAISASAFTVNSSKTVKTDIIKHNNKKMLDIIMKAPSHSWRYKDDVKIPAHYNKEQTAHRVSDEWKKASTHHGPMAEDLPEEVRFGYDYETDGTPMTDVRDLVGVVWGAIPELVSRIEELESQLAAK